MGPPRSGCKPQTAAQLPGSVVPTLGTNGSTADTASPIKSDRVPGTVQRALQPRCRAVLAGVQRRGRIPHRHADPAMAGWEADHDLLRFPHGEACGSSADKTSIAPTPRGARGEGRAVPAARVPIPVAERWLPAKADTQTSQPGDGSARSAWFSRFFWLPSKGIKSPCAGGRPPPGRAIMGADSSGGQPGAGTQAALLPSP